MSVDKRVDFVELICWSLKYFIYLYTYSVVVWLRCVLPINKANANNLDNPVLSEINKKKK